MRGGHGAGVSTGSRPSSLRPGPSASGKAPSLSFGSAVSHFSAPSKSPGAPVPSLASPRGRRLVLGCSCLLPGGPGSPPGASFLEEEKFLSISPFCFSPSLFTLFTEGCFLYMQLWVQSV